MKLGTPFYKDMGMCMTRSTRSTHTLDNYHNNSDNVKMNKAKKHKACVIEYTSIHIENSIGGIDLHPKQKNINWVGGGSFEDKRKRRPKNIVVENLPGSGWGKDICTNPYSGNMGSCMDSSEDTYFDAPAHPSE